jgi:hypothetical protein
MMVLSRTGGADHSQDRSPTFVCGFLFVEILFPNMTLSAALAGPPPHFSGSSLFPFFLCLPLYDKFVLAQMDPGMNHADSLPLQVRPQHQHLLMSCVLFCDEGSGFVVAKGRGGEGSSGAGGGSN